MVINCGAELFTGNTAMVMAAVYEGKATWLQLTKNWVWSYLGNLLGSLAFVWILVQAGTLGTASAAGVAVAKTSLTFGQVSTTSSEAPLPTMISSSSIRFCRRHTTLVTALVLCYAYGKNSQAYAGMQKICKLGHLTRCTLRNLLI